MIQAKRHIAGMSTYKPPWSNIDRSGFLRLDLNENTLSPPGHVKSAMKKYIDDNRIQMYPDYQNFLPKLSKYADVDAEQLILTNGSDQAIEIVLRAFLGMNDEMVMAQPGFPMFTQIAGVIGAKVIGVPYNPDMSFPYKKYFEAITRETKLAVIINPDNPTGASISISGIEDVLKLRDDLPALVDEAYFEFTSETAMHFLKAYPNLIILRTFSKAFAMAGLRLGYIIANPDIISQFYKIRGPFDVNSCALTAAGAQLDFDREWKRFVNETMTVSKPYLETFFKKNNVSYYPGAANFMLVQPADRNNAVDYLKKNGILVRPMTAPCIENTFRMNIGTLEQTKHFAHIYKRYIIEKDKDPGKK
jgi:histidinol-phosphate aminotransferase